MSTSKRKKSNLTYATIYLIFLMVLLVFPNISDAKSEYWYFIQKSRPNSIGTGTIEECQKYRKSTLVSLVSNGKGDELVTECFKFARNKPLIEQDEYETFFKTYPPQKASVALETAGESWWIITKYIKDISGVARKGDHYVAGPYDSKTECEKYQKAIKTDESVLVEACKESKTKPTTPQNIIPQVNTKTTYEPLAPLPGMDPIIDTQKNDTTNPCPFGKYLNVMIKLFLGICGVLAVIMIVMGGIQYMTSELVSSKEEGRKSITQAILGLLIALGAYLILNTINPDLLNVCLNTLPTATIEISEESVNEVGPGFNQDGTIVKISTGSATTCTGGIVDIPSSMGGSGKICKDLLTKLSTLQSKTSNWRITSAIRDGKAQSSCHYSGAQNSGNCADLQINSSNSGEPGYSTANGSNKPEWGDFCLAVAQVGGLNYLNEASKVPRCQGIQNYKAYKNTSGPHLHVNYIGGSSVQGESYKTVNYYNKGITVWIKSYDSKRTHKINMTNTDHSFIKTIENANGQVAMSDDGTTGYIIILLTDEEYNKIKNSSIPVSVWSGGVGLGTKNVSIN